MEKASTHSVAERNFILQQGFEDLSSQSCHSQYSALLFQPRIVAIAVLGGILTQSPPVFLLLWVILWWSALLPAWNPFDAIYNRLSTIRRKEARLSSAPGPRRFAQSLAGLFALGIAASLLYEWNITAYILEGLFFAAVVALVFGRFCLGSFIYHFLHGQSDFARRTLPWKNK